MPSYHKRSINQSFTLSVTPVELLHLNQSLTYKTFASIYHFPILNLSYFFDYLTRLQKIPSRFFCCNDYLRPNFMLHSNNPRFGYSYIIHTDFMSRSLSLVKNETINFTVQGSRPGKTNRRTSTGQAISLP